MYCAKVQRYGAAFLKALQAYALPRYLTSQMHLKLAKKPRSQDRITAHVSETKQATLQLYRLGKTIAQIMEERNLKQSTIEEHLATSVLDGQLSVDLFVSPEKQANILRALENYDGIALAPIKLALGDDYSYGEIKMVMADKLRAANVFTL